MAYAVRKNTSFSYGTFNHDEGGLVKETIYEAGSDRPLAGKTFIFTTKDSAKEFIVNTIGCDDWSDDNKRFWKYGTYSLRVGESSRPDWTIEGHNGRGGKLIG
jgi:hypothetical protein